MLKRHLTEDERKALTQVFSALYEKDILLRTEGGNIYMDVSNAEATFIVLVEGVLRGELLPHLISEATT